MNRPPSQAVIEAVERAEREHRWFEWCGDHPDGEFCCECGAHDTSPGWEGLAQTHKRVWGHGVHAAVSLSVHIRDEVARAAEQAADEKWMRWLIEQLHYGIDTSCEVDPPCTLADYAAMWERIDPREKHMAEVIVAETGAWADELTDTDDRSK